MKKPITMKNYHVILTSLVDPVRDVESETPETKEHHFDVEATSEEEAKFLAKEEHPLSVWNY